MLPINSLKLGAFLGLAAFAPAVDASGSDCRCFPGDQCWPSLSTWDAFNQSVNGRLVATVPLATPCHTPNYNSEKCEVLKDGWLLPEEHYKSSSSFMAPFFTNGTCDPYHPVSKPCTLGNFVRYAVNVSESSHVAKTLQFATEHNIRFIIRNTGHDYNGKSTGAGALSVWTHHLKGLEFKDWKDKYYTGKALKMGAGIQGIEAYEAAQAQGLRIVSGECPTVGIAGGYSQGGGHSALSSRYGLGADQVLEWEVIDGNGRFLVANRQQNTDLFWALCGGGGGTYGVVWSMTSKAHADGQVSGLNLTFTTSGISDDTFFEAVEFYNTRLPSIVDEGVMSLNFLTNTSFSISPMTGPDVPLKKLKSLIEPVLNELKRLGITYTYQAEEFGSYLEQFNAQVPLVEVGVAQYGSWLLPRSIVTNLSTNRELTQSIRTVLGQHATFTTVAINVAKNVTGDVYNAVNPAWRTAIAHVLMSTPWEFNEPEQMAENRKLMTDLLVPSISKLAPESGAYLNECDFDQPNWKKAFYGKNYNDLLAIKSKYDPHSLFYGLTAVGSDEWTVSNSGRMCRVATASGEN
ncbi:FAD binding domain protein [Penicillium cataractarum]|uniref:FAD binding domain protein n=1 Tax=Penicillium cataractarum TaxID=2100454 RepID=A0A9W9UVX6_9EURO|nr:FAD binding domain protein [Penicillium cataractarum]KAJ5358569.1 FAD binding domain protein [Penicillium cataractarum]